MNRIYFVLTFILACFTLAADNQTSENPVLIVNSLNKNKPPHNLRLTTNLPLLQGLNASASCQFSEESFLALTSQINTDKILIVDLREESHGFLNRHAVSWHTKHNWANVGKTYDEILADEKNRLDLLKESSIVLLSYQDDPLFLIVKNVVSEEELVHQQGYHYLRIPVSDHKHPNDEQVDRFVEELSQLPEDVWVHFHCRAGKGRASLFMVLYDIMRSKDHATLNQILERQALLGNKDFTEVDTEESWKRPLMEQRIQFIQNFYCYWNETHGEISWTKWSSSL